ncbi:MAG TPA: sigma-70 family RNA polymerase sigma factor [Bryobacteraceae bacterium]|nr:sigma-70 family RNA polymerase sigma factor [Bryobacteraceae bacterium]
MERITETDLAAQLIAGAPGAFDRFVDYFRPKIFQHSWLMCGDREDAEEVAQEALLKVFESIDQVRDPSKIKFWVFRIAKNACLAKRRRSIFAPSRELSLDEFLPAKTQDSDGMRIEIADWSAQPDELAHQAEMKAMLESAIRQLPEMYRSVILLRDVEELTTQETARVLDLGEDVVKTRLHRARLAIRKTLDEYLRGREAVSDGTAQA